MHGVGRQYKTPLTNRQEVVLAQQTQDFLMIHSKSLAAQLDRYATVTVAAVFDGDPLDTVAQLDVVFGPRALSEAAIETGATHSSEFASVFDAE